MADLQRKTLCPRLIDYLAIVGVRHTNVPRPSGGNNVSGTNPAVQVFLKIDYK